MPPRLPDQSREGTWPRSQRPAGSTHPPIEWLCCLGQGTHHLPPPQPPLPVTPALNSASGIPSPRGLALLALCTTLPTPPCSHLPELPAGHLAVLGKAQVGLLDISCVLGPPQATKGSDTSAQPLASGTSSRMAPPLKLSGLGQRPLPAA